MRILLIEDDAVLRGVMHASLTDAGHRVDEASTLADARTLWLVQQFDAVLLDLNLVDGSGLSALREARRRGDTTPVLVLSARGGRPLACPDQTCAGHARSGRRGRLGAGPTCPAFYLARPHPGVTGTRIRQFCGQCSSAVRNRHHYLGKR